MNSFMDDFPQDSRTDTEAPAPGPLSGITVVDLSRVLAGPYATMVLADLGARVIKVERPGEGDDSRGIGPFKDGKSAYFTSINRGKQSIALDLKDAGDRQVFEALLQRADVLVENYRPGTIDKLGYGWPALHERYPQLIYAAASGFGHSGPDSRKAAYDMVVQAMGGIMSVTGHPGGPPTRVGTSIGDITAGLFTVIGILSALHDRRDSGSGRFVDVAMLDGQIAILENAIARYAVTGEAPGPLGARHPSITPFAAFRCRDAHIVIAAGNDSLFRALCDVLGLPDLPGNPRFASNNARSENAEALHTVMEAQLETGDAATWLARLDEAGVPAGPLQDVGEALAHPQVRARNMAIRTAFEDGTPLTAAGNPVKISGFDDPATRPKAPALDEHRAAILAELGLASGTEQA
ncbi:carnitine dehydratase [Pacificimonas flava]|uniref:Carnitine dehydratase n=2 Tax=Pacificimonas TaxID=1960290 RepID=A0A219B3T1_9SPHN|nr:MULTISPECIES: CoA transferase [Pacificimonas]MBZ6377273.1 CoA transferase [Pacificimonas aurantium]OWV33015.1 carnitine dehydratase [Pacificimonas flava]